MQTQKESGERITHALNENIKRLRSHIDVRLANVHAALSSQISDFEAHMTERMNNSEKRIDDRFKAIDARFEKIDERFEKIDERFEKIDERFEKIDVRFQKIDKRFDTVATKSDLHDVVEAILAGIGVRLSQNNKSSPE